MDPMAFEKIQLHCLAEIEEVKLDLRKAWVEVHGHVHPLGVMNTRSTAWNISFGLQGNMPEAQAFIAMIKKMFTGAVKEQDRPDGGIREEE
ncbi:MAG TPA: hypothetical protein VM223_13415 [Planctomycetota bacterium]|nr:hypothetical protein [Planctomycetota bacterium]